MITPRRRPPAAVASYSRAWPAALVAASVWAHIATSSLWAQAITLPAAIAAAAATAEEPSPPASVATFSASTIMVTTEAAPAASAPAAAQTAAVAAATAATAALTPRSPEGLRNQPARRRRTSDGPSSEKPAAYFSVAGGGSRTREASGAESIVVESLTRPLSLAGERELRWGSGQTRGGEDSEARAAAGGVSVIEAVGKAGRAGEGRGEGVDVANGDRHQRKGSRCAGNICGGGGRHRGAAVSGDLGRLVEDEVGLETARHGDLELEGRGEEVREVNTSNEARAERHFLRTASAGRTETQALAATATAPGAAAERGDDGDAAESRSPPHKRSGKAGGARVVEDDMPFPASSKPFPGRHGGGGLRPARRRAAEEVESSTHDSHGEGDDEAVDGFGSVGLLAFVVCFGLLFCVMEGWSDYLSSLDFNGWGGRSERD